MVEVQQFATGTRYGLEILDQWGISVKTKSQKKVLETNSYVRRSYNKDKLVGDLFAPLILNRVNTEDRKGFFNKENMLKFTKLCNFKSSRKNERF